MSGESFSSDVDYASSDPPEYPGDEEDTPTCCNVVFLFFLGLGLTLCILVAFLGITALGTFVLIPIEQWSESLPLPTYVIIEILLFVPFVASFAFGSYVIGIVNRFGVQHISKSDLPKNRKWTIFHGFLILMVGWILTYNVFSFTMSIERSDSYWLALGGLALTNAIEWLCMTLTGLIGYVVATKSPLFRNNLPEDGA